MGVETCDPSGVRTGGDLVRRCLLLNQDFQDSEDFLALGLSLDDARSSLVLNQDLQDFQD